MTERIPVILTLNAGSSSLKFRVFSRHGLERLAKGAVSRIGGDAVLKAGLTGGAEVSTPLALGTDHGADHGAALNGVLDWVRQSGAGWKIEAVAHRIVHGGTDYEHATLVTEQVMSDLEALIPYAPLHQPHGLAAIRASDALLGDIPDVACFDTAFHTGRNPLFTHFALPQDYYDRGIRRYGFHGLSYQWIAHRLLQERPDLARGRVIAAHLGNGASLCAMRAGRSVDTTMGMTAVDGVPMGTRSGAIDPGAILLLKRSFGMSLEEIEDLIYNRAGLLGLSGKTNDVATLLLDETEAARFALDFFCLKIAQAAAGLAVSLGGIDALVFTGGIGENAGPVRDSIVQRLGPLGRFEVLVIEANEERMMAMEAIALLEA